MVLLRKDKGGPHHLHGADVLLLLHVDVSQIQPDVADVSRGLPDLCEDIPSFSKVALVGQDGTWTEEVDIQYFIRSRIKEEKRSSTDRCHWPHRGSWSHFARLVCISPRLDPGVAFPAERKKKTHSRSLKRGSLFAQFSKFNSAFS